MKNEPEIRSLVHPIEHRALFGGDGSTASGYAAVFGETVDIGGHFLEVIERGAFTDTLKTADVRAYFDHDRGRVLGRSTAGTLRLNEDSKGLAVEIDLPDTSDGRDVRTLVDRGDVSGMSIGFVVTREEWDQRSEPATRIIHEISLREVSIVSEPAYDGTSVALRSLEAARETAKTEAERTQAEHNRKAAEARIAERKALSEQRFRKIN